MYNLLISLAGGLLVSLLLVFIVELNVWASSLIGLAVMTVAFVLIARAVVNKVTALFETVQKDLQANRPEKAVKVLESGMKYARWQFFMEGQIRSQIGMIYFLRRDFSTAFEYLKDAFVRNWAAMGMLAVTYMKRNKTSQMITTFENAVSANRKEPMLWNLYAYCLEEVGEHDKAVAVMEKGLKKVGKHELLETNLELLKERKKMKMMEWGEVWYQFHLEKTGAIVKQQTKAVQGRRKIPMR